MRINLSLDRKIYIYFANFEVKAPMAMKRAASHASEARQGGFPAARAHLTEYIYPE